MLVEIKGENATDDEEDGPDAFFGSHQSGRHGKIG